MYKDAIKKFPVKTGDIWESKEGHKLYCGDNRKVPAITNCDFCYTDPPWSDKILQNFYQYANSPDEIPSLEQFLFQSFTAIKSWLLPEVTTPFIIDMGTIGKKATENAAFNAGLYLSTYVLRKYGKSSPMLTYYYSLRKQRMPVQPLSLLDGWDGTRAIMEQYPNRSFLEPFAGEGYFVEMALKNGCRVTAIELIPDKFASMLQRLSKHTKFERTGTWLNI